MIIADLGGTEEMGLLVGRKTLASFLTGMPWFCGPSGSHRAFGGDSLRDTTEDSENGVFNIDFTH